VLQLLFLIGAWSRGWKARALIPIGLAIGLGVIMASAGVSFDGKDPIALVPDFLCTIVLGVMCVVRPASATAPVAAVEDETQAEPVQALASE
jgi:hypothetical protein